MQESHTSECIRMISGFYRDYIGGMERSTAGHGSSFFPSGNATICSQHYAFILGVLMGHESHSSLLSLVRSQCQSDIAAHGLKLRGVRTFGVTCNFQLQLPSTKSKAKEERSQWLHARIAARIPHFKVLYWVYIITRILKNNLMMGVTNQNHHKGFDLNTNRRASSHVAS